jgi:hypothetical protein
VSYKAEVIADRSGEWTGNALRFATHDEAKAYVEDLMWRWTAVRDVRVVQCEDPVNYAWRDGKVVQWLALTPEPKLNDTKVEDGRKFAYDGTQWREVSPITGEYFK